MLGYFCRNFLKIPSTWQIGLPLQLSISILSRPQGTPLWTIWIIIPFPNCPSNLNLHASVPDELINACLIT